MRAAVLVAVSLSSLLTVACEAPRRAQSLWFNQVEVVSARRNPESGLEPTDDDQSLLGVTLLHYGDEHTTTAFELGLRGGRFERVAASSTNYLETHAGVRWHPLGVEDNVRPYLGLGLIWNGRGSTRDRIRVEDDNGEGDSGAFLAALATWVVAQAGPYATLGIDVSFGSMVLGAGVRAACTDGVDLSARNSDDFALDVFATIGWSF